MVPPDDVAFAVDALWWGAWDLRGQPPHETHLLADPCVNVAFEAGEGRVVGVWTRLWTRVLEEQGYVRAVKLRVGAVRALLDVEAHTLANRILPLSDVFDGSDVLAAEILAPDDPADGLDRLLAWVRQHLRDDPEVRQATAIVEAIRAEGHTRVEAVAADAGISARALQRLFRRNVGATPKSVIRRFRLQEVAMRVEAGEAPDLATLALELGYADQAHLARDFRAATGRTLRGFEQALDD